MIIWLFDYLIFDCLIVWLFDFWLFDYLIIWLFDCLIIWLFDFCRRSLFLLTNPRWFHSVSCTDRLCASRVSYQTPISFSFSFWILILDGSNVSSSLTLSSHVHVVNGRLVLVHHFLSVRVPVIDSRLLFVHRSSIPRLFLLTPRENTNWLSMASLMLPGRKYKGPDRAMLPYA